MTDSSDVPARLGDFAIEGVLGRGGSAIVYAATKDGRELALKVIKSDAGERQRARFLDEAKLLARVVHPNVVEVVEAGVLDDGAPFLAMPRLRGETLASRLTRGRLPYLEALACFEGVAKGVLAIHEAGLLHRDLKPENVFLVEGGAPIVLDLGIGREVDAAPSTTTEEGVVRGTPATMAPERFFGARASIGSDVYELGLLLYAMLLGRLPWADSNDAQERLQATAPHELEPSVPKPISEAVVRALATRVDKRPASVRALVDALHAAMEEVQSAPTTAVAARTTPPKPPSSARWPLAAAALVAAIAIAAVALRSKPTATESATASASATATATATATASASATATATATASASASASASATEEEEATSAPQPLSLPWCRRAVAIACDPKLGGWGASRCSYRKSRLAGAEKLPLKSRPAADARCKNDAASEQKAIDAHAKGDDAMKGARLVIADSSLPHCHALIHALCYAEVSMTVEMQKTCTKAKSLMVISGGPGDPGFASDAELEQRCADKSLTLVPEFEIEKAKRAKDAGP